MSQYDTQALAGQTFYRGVAGPAIQGKYAYIGVYNPTGSGITTYIDDFSVWAGLPVGAEVGIMHYATAFNTVPDFNYYGTVPLNCTHIGMPMSKTQLWIGAYAGLLNPWIDYVFVSPTNIEGSRLEHPPYPLIVDPGDGIVFWNPTAGYELKVNLWVRELPVTSNAG